MFSRATHFEHQPHKYGMSWTTHHTGSSEDGGHFYLAKYGIHVQSASNTFVAWQPCMAHGTSLQCISPDDPTPANFRQTGLSILTSTCMRKAWEKYLESKGQVIPGQSLVDEQEQFSASDE